MQENLPDIQDKEIKKVDFILTQEDVNELFEYRDGELYWKIDIYTGKNNSVHKIKIGDKAGCIVYIKNKKYPNTEYPSKHIRYQGKNYITSRIIFLMFNGYLPECISFKDGNSLNTRIENLIESNNSQINYKSKIFITNKTGYKGVHFYKRNKKYCAMITKNYKTINLGYYDTPEEAHKAYLKAKEKYHGEFLKKCVS